MHPSYLTPISSGTYVLGFAFCLLTWLLANSMPLASCSEMGSAPHRVTADLEQRIAGFIN